MTILSSLLRWLLPPLTFFVLSITLFFYFYWHSDITDPLTLLALAITLISGLALLACVFFVVNSISKPIQQLKEAALDIAAGDYRSTTVPVKAPEEIADLADALHTMSECVQENISRMREDSTRSERMHGEYECALLLQQHMLHKVVEENLSHAIDVQLINHRSATSPQGLLLQINNPSKDKTEISFFEAIESGFSGIFKLLKDPHESSQKIQMNIQHLNPPQVKKDYIEQISEKESLDAICEFSIMNMPQPVIWSARKEMFILSDSKESTGIQLERGDLIFLYNHGFAKCFDRPKQIQEWFQKVLRHFAVEGMELFVTMLNCEVNFLARKQHIDHDINIIYIQLL
jgi:HAMP domain-containing protein